jgi:hypothetical protein
VLPKNTGEHIIMFAFYLLISSSLNYTSPKSVAKIYFKTSHLLPFEGEVPDRVEGLE